MGKRSIGARWLREQDALHEGALLRLQAFHGEADEAQEGEGQRARFEGVPEMPTGQRARTFEDGG